MAGCPQTAAAAAGGGASAEDSGGNRSNRRLCEPGGGLEPLLTVRSSSCFADDAAAAATVGCLCFLSPSVLAAGDTVGGVSFVDLLTRRPLAAFAAAATCSSGYRRRSSSNVVSGFFGSSSSSGSGRLSWKDTERLRSPLLQMAVVEGPAEASSPPAATSASAGYTTAAAFASESHTAAPADRLMVPQGERSEAKSSKEEAETAAEEVTVSASAGDIACGRQLLLQQKSSLFSLWDVDYLTPCCRFCTGAYSFCKFALLQEPKQQHWQARHGRQQQENRQQQLEQHGDKATVDEAGDGPTDDNGIAAVGAGALLLAAPVADADAIGIFDLRCCRQSFAARSLWRSGSRTSCSLAASIAQPAVTLKPAAAAAVSACADAPPWTGTGAASLGAVHALAAAPGSTAAQPLLLAAYEFPCVALWDVRNNKQPLSTSLLPSPMAAALSSTAAADSSSRSTGAAPAAPPSCMTVYRNQCWVGSFEGDMWVVKLKQRTRTLSAPVFTVSLSSSEAGSTSSPTERKSNKLSHRYSKSQQLHLNASFPNATAAPATSSSACTSPAREASDTSADLAARGAAGLSRANDAACSRGASDTGAPTEGAVVRHTRGSSAALAQTPLSPNQLVLRSAAAAPALVSPSASAYVLSLPHPDGDIGRQHALLCTTFRPDGAIVGVGTADGVIHLFETKSRGCLGSLRQQGAEIKALSWCSQTGVLAATAAAGRVTLWGLYLDSYSVK